MYNRKLYTKALHKAKSSVFEQKHCVTKLAMNCAHTVFFLPYFNRTHMIKA